MVESIEQGTEFIKKLSEYLIKNYHSANQILFKAIQQVIPQKETYNETIILICLICTLSSNIEAEELMKKEAKELTSGEQGKSETEIKVEIENEINKIS